MILHTPHLTITHFWYAVSFVVKVVCRSLVCAAFTP
ncbi:DUF3265 domain-containing protein [Vibrio parahaemolyticus]|nr:DUF3265 domain-containing protein [Vibrio parahaemolyticus]OOQ67218.1 hypothetical protein BSR61_25550 [Vibrio parahaemolyticus]PMT73620.1 DUF3265 domain-containing protein [Vibrio parahaemolyticus]PMT78803.1 DUF3265 domain-containing protein [Vibrio parahaemolyticus]